MPPSPNTVSRIWQSEVGLVDRTIFSYFSLNAQMREYSPLNEAIPQLSEVVELLRPWVLGHALTRGGNSRKHARDVGPR